MKIDRLIEETTEKDGVKKWKVIVGIVVGLGIVFAGLYGYIFVYSDVDTYLQDRKLITNLYDFYDLKVGNDETAVYFIGSSIIGRSIYPPEINNILSEKGYDIKTYNLYYTGDIPLERSLEIQKIIDSNPSLVIYGVTYRSVVSGYDKARFSERVNLVYDRLDVRDDAYVLFTPSEIEEICSIPNLDYFMSFVDSAQSYKASIQKYGISKNAMLYDYAIDPYGFNYRVNLDKNDETESAILKAANNPNNSWRPIITNESTRYKDAFLYNVKTLQDAGVPVVIINMPIHPLVSEKITDESRQNFYGLLNQTGATWYDMERDYDSAFFRDTVHARFDTGALVFAPVMADLIIQELS